MFLSVFILWFGMLHEEFNEYIEHKWIKAGSSFHNWFHTSKSSVTVPAQDHLIVFIHVPRTSGETLKIALFNQVDYQFDPQWVDHLHQQYYTDLGKHMSAWQRAEWFNDEVIAPPKPWPVGVSWPSNHSSSDQRPWKGREGRQGTEAIEFALKNGPLLLNTCGSILLNVCPMPT
jgi:hypothetical protein